MKSVRFSKVVEKSGNPEVYLLMSETDPDFQKALEADKIMSLSDESHGSGTEYGRVGYDKKRHGQLLIFPKSLKSFSEAKIIGIKYDLLAEDREKEAEAEPSRPTKKLKKPKEKASAPPVRKKLAVEKPPKPKKKSDPKPSAKKLIPFPPKKEAPDEDEDDDLKACVRQAMRALEKGNSVAAYNILKRIIPDL